MQNITISGNLTSDAVLSPRENSGENMSFRVAANDTRKGEKTATFYDVVAGKTGAFDYLRKGQSVVVSGRLAISVVEKEGKTYVNLDIYARDIELTGGQKNG